MNRIEAALRRIAAEQLVRSLTAAGYGLSALVEQDAVGRLATVRLISPDADGVGVVIDLIFDTAGIEALGSEERSTARTAVELKANDLGRSPDRSTFALMSARATQRWRGCGPGSAADVGADSRPAGLPRPATRSAA